MINEKHFIICSHGFGVAWDDRGLFPDAAALVNDAKVVMFDYNVINEVQNTITIAPFDDQVKKLEKIINETKAAHPQATIDLLCHSQGCLIAALLKPDGIRKTIFLAPPYSLDAERTISQFTERPGTKIDRRGVSLLERLDGTTTIVPKEFWDGMANKDCAALYNNFAECTELEIVNASQDEVLGNINLTGLSPKIKIINIDGSHNFGGAARDSSKKLVVDFLAIAAK
jgi:hypothetical protein